MAASGVSPERPIIQSIAAALVGLRRRSLWLVLLLVVLSVPLWLLARPWVTQRFLKFELTVDAPGQQWAVEWERTRDGLQNGAWLDLASLLPGTETLEIRPSGQAHEAGRNFEFWLYTVTPTLDADRAPDLKALLEASGDALWHRHPAGVGHQHLASVWHRLPAGGTAGTEPGRYTSDLWHRHLAGVWHRLPAGGTAGTGPGRYTSVWHRLPAGGTAGTGPGRYTSVWHRLPAGGTAGTEPDRYTSVGGHWIAPPPSVPGIVYADNQPGLLRLELPSGGVTVAAAKTATGGPVEFRYADDVRTVNMHASPNEAFTVHLKRRSVPPDQSLWVRRPLPNYPLQRLRLSWYDSPGAHFTLSNVKLQETLFGRRIRARSITPLVHQGVVETGHEGKTFRFEASSAAGAVLFPIPIKLGSRINAVGYGLTLVVLLMLVFGGPLLWQLVRRIPRPVRSFEAVALGLVVVAHVWMAAWSPLVFVPDSLDYVHSSMVFWETWSLDHIHPGRVPGFTVFIAPFVAGFQDFGAALGWVHAALGILGAWLARGMVKPFAPRPWPGVALLVVGLNPLALMYERIMLSECLASFCALLAAWMIVRLTAWNTAGRLSWRTGLLMAAGIGLVGGLAPYVRGNLQIVVALGPLVLLLSSCRRPRRLQVLVQAVTVGVVGVACLAPWIARNARYCGRAEFIIGKHYQRLEEGSQLGCQFTDDNQTLAFDYDHWQQIRERLQTQQRYALPAELYHSRLRPEPLPDRYHAVQREKMCRPIIDETVARQPLRTLLNMAAALATQLGLWNKFPQSRAENAYWSLPLRGVVRTTWANTNFIADTDMLSVTGPADAWKADLAQRVRHDISYVVESPHARLYNEWFWAYRFLAPVMAILFLIGLGLSLWHGRYAMFGVGLFPLANAAALAILIISNVERYSMPFNGLMLVVAVYGVYLLTQRRTAAPTAG